jgi:hypothetical protein
MRFLSAASFVTEGYAVLPGGSIRFGGRSSASSSGTLAVTGGTGRFAHARGSIYDRNLGGATDLNVYRLTLP